MGVGEYGYMWDKLVDVGAADVRDVIDFFDAMLLSDPNMGIEWDALARYIGAT